MFHINSTKFPSLLLILLVFIHVNGVAMDVLIVDESKESFSLVPNLELYHGPATEVFPKELDNFTPYTPQLLEVGKTHHWFRVSLQNTSDHITNLFVSTFFLDSIVLYKQVGDSVNLISSNNGYLVPVVERAKPFAQTSIIPMRLGANEIATYYFHVINYTKDGKNTLKSSMRMGFVAYTNIGFEHWYKRGELFHYFAAGMMVIVALFNFLLFLINRQLLYILLTFNNLAYLAWILIFGGILLSCGLVEDLEVERIVRQAIPTLLVNFTYFVYSISFLKFRQHFPKLYRAIVILISVHTAMLIPHLLGYHESAIIISELVAPLVHLPILIGSFILWKRNEPYANYFTLGVLCYNSAVVIFLLIYNNPDINYLVGHYFVEATFILEVLIFSIINALSFTDEREKYAVAISRDQILQQELDIKSRQLVSLTVQTIKKNEVLEKLKTDIDKNPNDDKSAKSIKREINNLLNFDGNWENFKLHFEAVHPDFFDQLTEQYGTLTSNEYRLAAFLRMGLKNKEIALILGISVRGVEKAKERLKKKMESRNLSDSINKI